jgi:spermidine/putrescine transport system permease protein
MDLGASPTQALRLVLMPLLYPAIALSTALVLARAIDDLVVVRYLAASSSSVTLTMKIYGGFRSAPTPVYNAMATVMTLMTLAMAGVAYSAFRRLEAARRT